MRGSCGSGSKGSGRVRGRAWRVGWLRGPRAVRPGLLADARGPAEGEKWRAGPVVWLRGLGRPAREAGLLAGLGSAARVCWAGWLGRLPLRASGPSRPSQLRASSFLFLFLFYFSFPLFKFKLIWNLNSKLVYLIHWSFRYEAHNILLYILETLFSYFV